MGVGGCQLTWKKCYEDVRFNVISVTRGWVGLKFPGKKRYVAHFNGLCKVKKIPENPNKLHLTKQILRQKNREKLRVVKITRKE